MDTGDKWHRLRLIWQQRGTCSHDSMVVSGWICRPDRMPHWGTHWVITYGAGLLYSRYRWNNRLSMMLWTSFPSLLVTYLGICAFLHTFILGIYRGPTSQNRGMLPGRGIVKIITIVVRQSYVGRPPWPQLRRGSLALTEGSQTGRTSDKQEGIHQSNSDGECQAV